LEVESADARRLSRPHCGRERAFLVVLLVLTQSVWRAL